MAEYRAVEVTIQPGDLVQLDPEKTKNPMFGACILTVSEVRSWGVQGYVQGLGENGKPGGQAYYRATWGTFEPTGGRSVWVAGSLAEEDDE